MRKLLQLLARARALKPWPSPKGAGAGARLGPFAWSAPLSQPPAFLAQHHQATASTSPRSSKCACP
ncbi:uncharacterized protein SETTUDRAFT_156240 [Exserohilum turcica Et28A]|uniref:Uncharacterized protein n=1 Tax=Exserohilum turcicum (strain 28A) TaxID=671987 RepID=R0K243_EXST2|nr:uncharacterized protein SETTUDRAFT_156240 [Exserohilum turcica Et28A]EOA82482.1 hypothetical protein SETTUDRAFT_156240 [Exserohilum turcica Et28A]